MERPSEYVPGAQVQYVVDPVRYGVLVPGRQSLQAEADATSLYVPNGHTSATAMFTVGQYVPKGMHPMHKRSPIVFPCRYMKEPGAQFVQPLHELAPKNCMYVPTAHPEQTEAPTALLYVPIVHELQKNMPVTPE